MALETQSGDRRSSERARSSIPKTCAAWPARQRNDCHAVHDAARTETLRRLEADHHEAVAALTTHREARPRAGAYQKISLKDLVARHRPGPMAPSNPGDVLGQPSFGRAFEVRGRLSHFDPEEMRLGASRRSYRIYRIENGRGGGRMWSVSLDLEALGRDERTVNLFSAAGGMTVVIGLGADHVEFHGIAR